jgi:uncharacterized membrane protein YbhN (UPF0104 family)
MIVGAAPPTSLESRRHSRAILVRARSPGGKRALTAASTVLAGGLTVLAARHFAASSWPLPHAHPGLLVAAAALFLLAGAFKAYGWRRLFSHQDAPRPLTLAAANGGACLMGLALPGRFDDVVRIAIVRRCPHSRAGVRTLCLSLFMLGLIDSAALTPLAVVAGALTPGGVGVRAALAVVAGAGFAAACLVVALPRLTRSGRVLRFRLGRWLEPRTTSFGTAWRAWLLVSACWLVRATGLFVLLGALGIGFSLTLALVFVCAGAAASAVPVGPAGAAAHVGAGAAVLVASGMAASQAISVATAAAALGISCAAATVLFALALYVTRRVWPSLTVGARGRVPVQAPPA